MGEKAEANARPRIRKKKNGGPREETDTHPTLFSLTPQASAPPPTHGTWDAIAGTWIVRFTAYRPAADHLASLAAALGRPTPATWAWVDRPNPAAGLPTDFGVVRVGEGSAVTKVG